MAVNAPAAAAAAAAAASTAVQVRLENKRYRVSLSGIETVGELKTSIDALTGVSVECQVMKVGFPPRLLVANSEDILATVGIRHGDVVILEKAESRLPKIVRVVIPSDNSCLFNSIAYVLRGLHHHQQFEAKDLRNHVCEVIASNPLKYDSSFLGRSNDDYVIAMRRPDSWGGGIELAILSEFFQVQLHVADVQTGRLDRFGEGLKCNKRAFLLYTGIHYDAIVQQSGVNEISIFDINDTVAEDGVRLLTTELRSKYEFTDLARFSLRCNICMLPLQGQIAAQDHAQKTGHVAFCEYK